MDTFTLNGKEYKALPFEIGMVCDLEEYGINLENMFNRGSSLIRAYVGICSGRGKDFATMEMQAHIMNGGNFEEINKVMAKKIEESDFFRRCFNSYSRCSKRQLQRELQRARAKRQKLQKPKRNVL